jgi:hypothetical protein
MKNLTVELDFKKAAAKLVGTFPDQSHVAITLDRDTKVSAPGGKLIAVLLRNAIGEDEHLLAHELWKPVDGLVSNRATALGTRSLPRSTNKHGVPSPRSGVNVRVLEVTEARQGILGYLDRPHCYDTLLSKEHQEMIEGNRHLIEHIDSLYAQQLPDVYGHQRSEVEKAGSSWRLWNTVFSTVYLAKNFRTAYHTDRGNLRGVMTALMPTGKFTGGELVLPRWRIAIAFKPGDLLLFDPQQVHGNLPFEGERISAAFYCSRHIADFGK